MSSIIKKKKKNIQRSQWSFWHSNEFHKIFLELFVLYYYNFIQLILILSFHLATKPRRLQNWNIPFFNFNKKNFVESFFKSIIFFIIVYFCLLYFYLLYSQHSFQGKIVENGIFEKKRLVNSDRYVSHISINFGNIVRYTKGQYSLMKTKAARSESRNCSF